MKKIIEVELGELKPLNNLPAAVVSVEIAGEREDFSAQCFFKFVSVLSEITLAPKSVHELAEFHTIKFSNGREVEMPLSDFLVFVNRMCRIGCDAMSQINANFGFDVLRAFVIESEDIKNETVH